MGSGFPGRGGFRRGPDGGKLLERAKAGQSQAAPLVPFAPALLALNDARLRREPLDAARAAAALDELARQVEAARENVEAASAKTDRLTAFRAQEVTAELKNVLKGWYEHYAGYDPLFTWWVAAPYKKASQAMEDFRKALRDKVLGIKPGEDEPIVGAPIGRDALMLDLASELIPYTPEELLKVADREFAWCEAELKKAARELGHGDDGKAALEKVKTQHAEPGKQPALILALAREAEAYLEEHGLITVPPLAREVWRMQMMTPERQKVNHRELVASGRMTDREFHDAIITGGSMPVEMVRARLLKQLLSRDHRAGWRFVGELSRSRLSGR